MRTQYPWEGRVTVHIVQTPDRPWTLSLRMPGWCNSATLRDAKGTERLTPGPGTVRRTRRWQPGDEIELSLDLPIRVPEPDPRVDAVRGCVAVQRGPLVYCIESADAPPQTEIEDLVWDSRRRPRTVPRPDIDDAMIGIAVPVTRLGRADELTAGAIPYYAWANRAVRAMRVWIPC